MSLKSSSGSEAFGAVFGIIAVLVVFEISQAPNPGFGNNAEAAVNGFLIVWGSALMSAHIGAVPGTGLFGSQFVDLAVPAVVYYLVPIAVLLWTGRRSVPHPAPPSPLERAVFGAKIAAGYLISLVVVVYVFRAFLFGEISLALLTPIPVQMFIVAGVVYPVVFGGLGALTVTSDAPASGPQQSPQYPHGGNGPGPAQQQRPQQHQQQQQQTPGANTANNPQQGQSRRQQHYGARENASRRTRQQRNPQQTQSGPPSDES
jgi:hypothetical protein